jgi:hypothetical protein
MTLRIRRAYALPFVLTLTTLFTTAAAVARAQSGPVTFGPNLAQLSVNNPYDCTYDPLILSPGNNFTGAPSCTWTSSDPTNSLGGQLPPGGEGTISHVMIKVGAVTGAMQVVIMRAEFQLVQLPYVNYNISCCTDVGQTAPFTPTANAITTEPVNLPVEVDTTANPANGPQTVDLVGLSVLEDGVPVPAADETTLSPENDQPSLDLEEPAMQDNGQPQLADDGTGYLVAMDSVWVPQSSNPGPAPAPTPTPPQGLGGAAPLTPLFSFPATGTLARVSGKNALVHLSCGGAGAACDGSVRLQSAPAHGQGAHTARKSKVVTYAIGSFSLGAGQSHTVKAKLSPSGRALAKQRKKVKVWINATLSGTTPAKIMSRQVTMRF